MAVSEQDDPPVGTRSLRVQVADHLNTRSTRRRLLPRAALVGVFAGLVAAAFRLALQLADLGRQRLTDALPPDPWLRFGVVSAVVAAGAWIALRIGKIDPDAAGSGIPHVKAVLDGHATMRWARLIWVKFLGGVVAIGSGLALGREGPTVQMGGAVGMGVSRFTHANARERRALIASGAGAGLAGAFNAPLAGVTFVLEELQRDFHPMVFAATLLCAAVATAVSRLATGQQPVFSVPVIPTPSLATVPLFVVLGALCGFAGVAFNRGLLACSRVISGLKAKSRPAVALGVGIVAGAAFSVSPLMLGGGHGLSEAAMHGEVLLLPAVAYLVVRFAMIHISFGSGVPGGIFAPLLSLGAVTGAIVYHVACLAAPAPGVGVAACAVAGMAAMFSGIVRAPLTGVVLIAEMTGSYDLLLFLLVASFTAYAVAEWLRDTPVYEALVQRDAIKRGWNLEDREPSGAAFTVMAGAPVEGRSLADAGFPGGVVVVLCREGGREFVPTAKTVLRSNTKLLVAADSPAGLKAVAEAVRCAPRQHTGG